MLFFRHSAQYVIINILQLIKTTLMPIQKNQLILNSSIGEKNSSQYDILGLW